MFDTVGGFLAEVSEDDHLEVIGVKNGHNGSVPMKSDGQVDTSKYTTVGRLLFNQILPERLKYTDKYLLRTMNKKALSEVITDFFFIFDDQLVGATTKFFTVVFSSRSCDSLTERAFPYVSRGVDRNGKECVTVDTPKGANFFGMLQRVEDISISA